MKIIYKTKKLEKICTDFNYAQKIYNHNIAKKISIRIDQLSSSNSTEDLILSHVGRCHSLKGNNLHSTYLAPIVSFSLSTKMKLSLQKSSKLLIIIKRRKYYGMRRK